METQPLTKSSRLLQAVALVLMAVGFWSIGLANSRAADPVLPVAVSFENQPYSVSWPDYPGFEAHMTVTSGAEGANFGFDVDTSVPLREEPATLDGPGTLKYGAITASASSLVPGSCGSVPPDYKYSLTVPPNTTTTVVIPASMVSAPGTGMTEASLIVGSDLPQSLKAPVTVGGLTRVQVDFGIEGYPEDPYDGPIVLTDNKKFRVAGSTNPILKNTLIRIAASPFRSPADFPPSTRWIEVKTDADGKFRSKPLEFGREAQWRLIAHPETGAAYDPEPTCGPAIETLQSSRPVYRNDLFRSYYNRSGSRFRSVSVEGIAKTGNQGVVLTFDQTYDPDAMPRRAYVIQARSGCGPKIKGNFALKNGHLFGRELSPKPGPNCRTKKRWPLYKALRQGLTARKAEDRIVLTNKKKGVRIVLRHFN